ncbi:unnamed protein product [Didymodactylos carnosus]|uniref:Uncharacterized protein n=1 Tax=Didymodactylos carnosus TaxID=1234261 RepID=A0A814ZW98_9BILA|nr:unnamed protein product [Didymodactylos carnosus]CAF1638579.1 unnamed protein product [Didymodactylos carnosus]CAF4017495.1 unnamed protein product [Didymodactylos carnosus]CAF4472510.1 unnamed protein product [Didymodactylos carnosus]
MKVEIFRNRVKNKLGLDETLDLKCHINLSRTDMELVKCFSSDFINISNRNLIKDHSTNLIPSIESCHDNKRIIAENREQQSKQQGLKFQSKNETYNVQIKIENIMKDLKFLLRFLFFKKHYYRLKKEP